MPNTLVALCPNNMFMLEGAVQAAAAPSSPTGTPVRPGQSWFKASAEDN